VKERTSSRLVWSIGLVSIGLLVGEMVFMYLDRHDPRAGTLATGWSFADVLNISTNFMVAGLGILLASRRRENPIGWLFLAAGLALGVSGFGQSYAFHALLAEPGSLPGGLVVAWVT
jgi:hypothetical protein